MCVKILSFEVCLLLLTSSENLAMCLFHKRMQLMPSWGITNDFCSSNICLNNGQFSPQSRKFTTKRWKTSKFSILQNRITFTSGLKQYTKNLRSHAFPHINILAYINIKSSKYIINICVLGLMSKSFQLLNNAFG